MKATNVVFINKDSAVSHYDETQFDTTDTAEVIRLWFDFCKENNINPHTVMKAYEVEINE